MNVLIASDIHGDFDSAEKVAQAYEKEGAELLIILGDILYHGPRNDLPGTYAPKKVIPLLNSMKEKIIAVGGNCDAEVDSMVLEFPITDGYKRLSVNGLELFLTHGHRYSEDNPAPLNDGEIVLCGHTHILKCEQLSSGNYSINPGSAAIPKGGNPRSYMLLSDKTFTVKDFDGNELLKKEF